MTSSTKCTKSASTTSTTSTSSLLFRTNESAFVETKRKLVDECELWAILSLPGGVFCTAGAGVKTKLMFSTKGRKSARTWYYDLSQVTVGKKTLLTLAHFGFAPDGSVLDDVAFPAALEAHGEQIREKDKAARDLEAQAAAIDAAEYDLKAVNPNAVATVDEPTPAEVIASIDAQGRIVAQTLAQLNARLASDTPASDAQREVQA